MVPYPECGDEVAVRCCEEWKRLEDRALRYVGEQLNHVRVVTADKLIRPNETWIQQLKSHTVEVEEVLRPFQETWMIVGIKCCAGV